MGKKKKNPPLEVDKKSMKELTKDHDDFMASRNEDRKVDSETAKERFDEVLKKAAKK
jgi:hypothetical protein